MITRADYTKLHDLLAAGQWREADEETERIILQVANRTEDGYLLPEDLDRFPCEDLRTLEGLWVQYGDGKFGFSIQQKIYEECSRTGGDNLEICRKFGDRVGWRKEGKWLKYSDLTFDRNHACYAHLPAVGFWCFGFVDLLFRAKTCNL
ncbi:MAG: GUN4 domain-containing protein [Spirulina sp.]